jgi:hypothetical protein
VVATRGQRHGRDRRPDEERDVAKSRPARIRLRCG